MEIEQIQVPHPGSWKDGSCCCNCTNLSILRKHPWNTSEFAKGPTSDTIGYVCTWGNEDRIATFMDDTHSFCEMHVHTDERMKYLNVLKASKKMGI